MNEEDSALFAKYLQTSRIIRGEVQWLEQQLEQQLAQQAAQEPIQIVPDEPEPPFVEPICAHCNELQQEVDNANGSLEVYEMEKAIDLVEAGNHGGAAAIFERLCKVRDDEAQRKLTSGDKAGAGNAKKEALKIRYEWAKALAELNLKEDAQNMMKLLKGVAEAIEHCTSTQVEFSVVTAIYRLRDGCFRQGSSNLPHWTLPYI